LLTEKISISLPYAADFDTTRVNEQRVVGEAWKVEFENKNIKSNIKLTTNFIFTLISDLYEI